MCEKGVKPLLKKTPNALDVHLHHTRLREKLSENQGSRLRMMEKLPKTHDDLRSRREVSFVLGPLYLQRNTMC